jgi:hypothetical protein
MNAMYILTDTFNGRELSRHRTIEAAVKAMQRTDRAVKRNNGSTSYLPMAITASDGSDIADAVDHTRYVIDSR